MKLPINSSADDFGIFFLGADSGMFSSNRIGGRGDDDVYSFLIPKENISISGKIVDNSTNTPVDSALLLLADKNNLDSTFSNQQGEYIFNNAKTNTDYVLRRAQRRLFEQRGLHFYQRGKGQHRAG
ncbi:MAG: carboxypeptidase-like regulatory domain-containing protein [Bacteroidales bacterium]|nr:carboxypeptidase-like regulatory domain-containing protein [Bacteroidales bacterium]